MAKAQQPNNDMLRGTLDMMVLRTLLSGDAHGHTIAKVIERTSDDVLEVEQGVAVPLAAPPRRPRLGVFVLGTKRDESQGQVLPADGGREKTAARGSGPLAPDG
jgi:hypothetical protein